MGVEERMADRCNTIRLYSFQTDVVYQVLKRDGVCYSKEEYVRKKYKESAKVFINAYGWFVKEAQHIVPKPEGAEYPYWAFTDLYNVDQTGDGHVLTLDVPIGEAIFFDMLDWTKIMQMHYIGENESEEATFSEELKNMGMNEFQIMTSNFYPEQKARIQESWKRLFGHQQAIEAGDNSGVHSVQAGLWCIKDEWIVKE